MTRPAENKRPLAPPLRQNLYFRRSTAAASRGDCHIASSDRSTTWHCIYIIKYNMCNINIYYTYIGLADSSTARGSRRSMTVNPAAATMQPTWRRRSRSSPAAVSPAAATRSRARSSARPRQCARTTPRCARTSGRRCGPRRGTPCGLGALATKRGGFGDAVGRCACAYAPRTDDDDAMRRWASMPRKHVDTPTPSPGAAQIVDERMRSVFAWRRQGRSNWLGPWLVTTRSQKLRNHDRARAHGHTHTHTQTNTLTHSHTHTYTDTHTRTHTLTIRAVGRAPTKRDPPGFLNSPSVFLARTGHAPRIDFFRCFRRFAGSLSGRGLAKGGGRSPAKSDEGQSPAPGVPQAVVMGH